MLKSRAFLCTFQIMKKPPDKLAWFDYAKLLVTSAMALIGLTEG
jgi:hypothetical protein